MTGWLKKLESLIKNNNTNLCPGSILLECLANNIQNMGEIKKHDGEKNTFDEQEFWWIFALEGKTPSKSGGYEFRQFFPNIEYKTNQVSSIGKQCNVYVQIYSHQTQKTFLQFQP